MKLNKVVFLVSFLLGLTLMVIIPVIIYPYWPIKEQAPFAIYLTAKIFFGIGYLFAGFFTLKEPKNATGISFALVLVSALVSFIPLALRGWAQADATQVLGPTILLLVSGLLYVAIMGGMIIMNSRMSASNKASEGKSIEIHEER